MADLDAQGKEAAQQMFLIIQEQSWHGKAHAEDMPILSLTETMNMRNLIVGKQQPKRQRQFRYFPRSRWNAFLQILLTRRSAIPMTADLDAQGKEAAQQTFLIVQEQSWHGRAAAADMLIRLLMETANMRNLSASQLQRQRLLKNRWNAYLQIQIPSRNAILVMVTLVAQGQEHA